MTDRDHRPITQEELDKITIGMQKAEETGFFNGMFSSGIQKKPKVGASKEKMLSSINPSMKLTKSFFKGIYGYEIDSPGFSEIALSKLEELGCSKAHKYYSTFVNEYEEKQKATMKDVAAWYVDVCNRKWEEKVRKNIKSKDVKSCNRKKYNSLTKRREALRSLIENLQESS